MSSTYAVSPLGMEAIERAVQAAMDGTGRVDPDELAHVLAEHEPERHRQEPREMSNADYQRSFAARFGPSFAEAAADADEGDEYAAEFARRFGMEAAL